MFDDKKIKKLSARLVVIITGVLTPIFSLLAQASESVSNDVPWGWYISRASGLVSFLLLWLVMFFGLSIRTPFLKRIFLPFFSLETHRWLSLQALFFVLLHSGALLFDRFLNFNIFDLIIPFHASQYTSEVTLGILGLYLMVILIVTSYFRNIISPKIWRAVHFLNILLFFVAMAHAFLLGTDLKNVSWLRNVFLSLNFFLIFVMIINLGARLGNWILAKKKQD